jgi:hypothetical protein
MNHRPSPPASPQPLAAQPRQPNRPLLLASAAALGLWVLFLLLVAVRVF